MLSKIYLTAWLLVAIGCSKSGGPAAVGGDECGLSSGQTGVKICSFVATPTSSESITLRNYDSTPLTLTGWTLWDANALGNGSGSKSLTGVTISAGGYQTIGSLPFQINDSGETITLMDNSGSTVSQRGN